MISMQLSLILNIIFKAAELTFYILGIIYFFRHLNK